MIQALTTTNHRYYSLFIGHTCFKTRDISKLLFAGVSIFNCVHLYYRYLMVKKNIYLKYISIC